MKSPIRFVTLFCVLLIPVFVNAGNRELADEVMAIHDVAMAKMEAMYELKLKLKELKQSKPALNETAISQAITDLENAHKGMMRWMREYQKPVTESELEQAGPYLLKEKEKIIEVGQAIDSSLENGKKLLTHK